ncbi:hypothetical protein AVEN_5646-1 [Araneus ventricosus]|uniref:Uncharacterized protein n=1 Tax=Araneus ventricosus TaxID=182803 RepID=A0A4Y2L2S7_ARAVE|nr:hypothetical protein AVEN_5646-1 [Araneus ventricosus]
MARTTPELPTPPQNFLATPDKMSMSPHLRDLPESEKTMSVCEHDNSKTQRARGRKFAARFLHLNYRFPSSFRRKPPAKSLCLSVSK